MPMPSSPEPAITRARFGLRHAPAIALGLTFAVLLLGQWRPLAISQISRKQDPSWQCVLGEATAGFYDWGSGVFFTGGPLSLVYTKYFQPSVFGVYLLVSYCAVVFCALGLTALSLRSRSWFWTGATIGLLLLPVQRDALFLFVPAVAAMLGLSSGESRPMQALFWIGAAVSGVITLAKFSAMPIALGSFLVIDVLWALRRRPPLATPIFAATTWIAFLGLTTPSSDFLLYLRGSLETSSGYAGAMSRPTFPNELACFLGLVAVWLIATLVVELRAAPQRGRALLKLAPTLLVVGLLFWVAFKAGFIRSDRYHWTAFPALAIGMPLFALARRYTLSTQRALSLLMVACALVGLTYQRPDLQNPHKFSPLHVALTTQLGSIGGELVASALALSSPGATVEALVAARVEAAKVAAKANPFRDRKFDGTVGTTRFIQSALVASGVDFRPHPSVHEYTSYTHWIIGRELEFIRGSRAPRYMMFAPGGIDKRYPTQVEGPTWPDLLRRYAPVHVTHGTALLVRRQAPLKDLLGAPIARTGHIGRTFSVSSWKDPIFVTLDLALTPLGRLVNVLYKPPEVDLEVTLEDGTTQRHRLIPGVVREGIVLSPLTSNAADYVQLATGVVETPDRRVVALRVRARDDDEVGFRRAYKDAFAVTIRPLNRQTLANAATAANDRR